jgi:hypothetical protein
MLHGWVKETHGPTGSANAESLFKSTEDAFYADLYAANQAVGKVLECIKYAQEKGIHRTYPI